MKPLAPIAFLLLAAWMARADDASDRHFLDRVKPLLDLRCVSCHGPDKVKGGLRLDSREAALKGGENGPSVVPGKPAESLLIHAVLHSKKDLEMPPKEKLNTNDIALLERWITDGAPWPKSPANHEPATNAGPVVRTGDAWHDPQNPIVRIFGGQRLDLWSLQPVKQIAPPRATFGPSGASSPIDRFIHATLSKSGLVPSPEADRRTLIRRLSFDLTGLPPTPEETAEFIAAPAPNAYQRLVDRLLASPRYGEHQARLWLDVIRYSDSNGFDWDEFRPRAWKFRDYVVRSFNADKPFDHFIEEQLAGDELLAGAPRTTEEQDELIATGYLRMGPHDSAAPLFNEQDRSRAELMADLVETTGNAFLGLTMGCCRCHDHKYDPLSQADHYRLRAFFEPVKFADDLPVDLATTQDAIRQQNADVDAQLAPLEKQKEHLLNLAKRRLHDERLVALTPEEKALLDLPKEKQKAEETEKAAALNKKTTPSDDEARKSFREGEKTDYERLGKEISTLKKRYRSFDHALLMTDSEATSPITKVLFQGNHKMEREPVVPGFISALDPNPALIVPATNPKTTGRRLTLARWMTSSTNPLTARVMVNRVWQQHFGRGLVATPNDFGLAGSRPSHPELLDWLATEFIRDGWSIKQLHRKIVTSETYRQTSTARQEASALDGDNVLLWRQNPRRLAAEQLRDALLATAGTLQLKPGGPPVWPELAPEILQANPAFLDDNETRTKGWYPSAKEDQSVRSLYLVQKRTVRVPFMETFDLPENSTSCARRNVSTVAPQALSLLNSPLAVESATEFASRVQKRCKGQPVDPIAEAVRLAFQRSPRGDELILCARLAEKRSFIELCRALLNLNEFSYID